MSRPLSVLLLLVVASWGCNRGVDPTTVLEPVDVETGWFDVGIVDGQNKLVPSITLKLRNKSEQPVESVQINAVFKRITEQEMWGDHYGWAIRDAPLPPGQATDELVLRSTLGYTGTEPRQQMLENSQFIDAKVEIFLKQGSRVWAKLAEFPIERQLLTQ